MQKRGQALSPEKAAGPHLTEYVKARESELEGKLRSKSNLENEIKELTLRMSQKKNESPQTGNVALASLGKANDEHSQGLGFKRKNTWTKKITQMTMVSALKREFQNSMMNAQQLLSVSQKRLENLNFLLSVDYD